MKMQDGGMEIEGELSLQITIKINSYKKNVYLNIIKIFLHLGIYDRTTTTYIKTKPKVY